MLHSFSAPRQASIAWGCARQLFHGAAGRSAAFFRFYGI